jgi:hypothetical protein
MPMVEPVPPIVAETASASRKTFSALRKTNRTVSLLSSALRLGIVLYCYSYAAGPFTALAFSFRSAERISSGAGHYPLAAQTAEAIPRFFIVCIWNGD